MPTTGAGVAAAPRGGGSGISLALGLGLGCVALLFVGGAIAGFLFFAGSRRSTSSAPPTTARECSGETCYQLGLRHEQGEGVPKNDFKAVQLYRRSCDDGFMLGCNALGNAHKNGFGGLPKDFNEARRLYERACNAGTMEGCHNLGVIHEAGLGVPVDKAKAKAFFSKSCRGGNSPSCERAKAL